jgi:hypothetical protein
MSATLQCSACGEHYDTGADREHECSPEDLVEVLNGRVEVLEDEVERLRLFHRAVDKRSREVLAIGGDAFGAFEDIAQWAAALCVVHGESAELAEEQAAALAEYVDGKTEGDDP